MFLPLAGQALLAAAVPGGLLVWNMHIGQQLQLAQRDREGLEGFANYASEAARHGRPLDQLIAELDQRDSNRLSGRVQLVKPDGTPIAGPGASGEPSAEAAINVGGQTVARARIVREPILTDDDRRYLATQYLGIGAIIAGLFVLLLVTAYEFARRWS